MQRQPTNYLKTTGRLLGLVLSTYRWKAIAVIATVIISALAGMAGPLFLLFLIDDYVTPMIGLENPDFGGMFHALLIFAAIQYTGVVSTWIYQRLMVQIGQGTLKRIRDDLFSHMQSLPLSYFDSHAHGDLMSLFTNDVDALRQMLSQSLPMALSAFVSALTTFTVMAILNLPLTLLTLVFIGIMGLTVRKITNRSGAYFTAQQKDMGNFNGFIEEVMSGQKVVKVFNHEGAIKEEFDAVNEQLFESVNGANHYANIMMPSLTNITYFHYILTAMVGAWLLNLGHQLTLGTVITYLQMTRSFSQPFAQMAQQFNSIIMALAGANRIFAVMDEAPEVDEGNVELVFVKEGANGQLEESQRFTGQWAWKCPNKSDNTVTYVPVRGKVDFEDMSFSYDGYHTVLHDLNLYAHSGEKLSFVGATGAGKTTITNLINRFYDVPKGQIRFDGIDVKEIKKADLRRSIGVILQDTHLFTGTIMENIRYGRLNASDEAVYAAARLTNADHFIQMLPDGYDTVISGVSNNLSQGQAQLLAIARAAIADPPVLIMDEATSSIDSRTEMIVQEGVDSLMEGRTVFVIAHRLSTIRNSDVIMVMDHGRIIERGDHDALIERGGVYHQLYTGALELD